MLLLGRFLSKERLIRCALYYFSNGIKALTPHRQLELTEITGKRHSRVIFEEAPLRCPTPYPFTCHFWDKRYPFHVIYSVLYFDIRNSMFTLNNFQRCKFTEMTLLEVTMKSLTQRYLCQWPLLARRPILGPLIQRTVDIPFVIISYTICNCQVSMSFVLK